MLAAIVFSDSYSHACIQESHGKRPLWPPPNLAKYIYIFGAKFND